MEVARLVNEKAAEAKTAARALAMISRGVKDAALRAMAESLEARRDEILEANRRDVEAARRQGLAPAPLDRLTLTPTRITEMADGLRQVAALPDPVGEIVKMWRRPNGILVGRMRVPLGVIGIVYESRPNVTVDTAGLCIKSGNTVVLRGGSEALESNRVLATILRETAATHGLPTGAIVLIDTPDRQAVIELLKQDQCIDLIIPRGGEALQQLVAEHARMPVIRHDAGVCHVYVDADADLAQAEAIVFNAKVQRPATCNAMETLLVHEAVAARFLPPMIRRLQSAGVEVRGDERTRGLAPDATTVRPAAEADWTAEYLDLILAVRVVRDMDAALDHIARYGSEHTETIVTRDHARAMRFLREVDSSCVLVNASTRLNDGYQLGLGAEVGISTSRIHARGPMGLEELTCTKFIVLGDGQLRE